MSREFFVQEEVVDGHGTDNVETGMKQQPHTQSIFITKYEGK